MGIPWGRPETTAEPAVWRAILKPMGVTTDEEFRAARERAREQREREAALLCPACHGTGFICDEPLKGERVGTVNDRACVCTLRADRERYLSGLPRYTFEAYDPSDNWNAWQAARLYAERKMDRRWLVMAAPPGRGKTHLAVAVLRARAEAEPPEMGVFRPVVELLDWFRAGMQPEASPDYETRISLACSWPLLVLDDLSAARTTPWALDALQRVIDARYREAERTGQETIFTTETVHGLPEHMVSRLLDGQRSCCMTLTGRDHRRKPTADG